MKRFICAALTAGCLISAVAFGGCAVGEATVLYTLSEDGTHYIVSGVGGDKRGLTSYEVPASYAGEEGGEMLPVTEIGDRAFFDCHRLNSVTLPDTVTKIGVNAFVRCSFREFTIPERVTFIGYGAFGMCENLREITVPESVETLEPLAFFCCSALQKAVIKANISVLEYRTFYNSMVAQGTNVFSDTSLTEIYLPSTLQKIDYSAIYGNFITDIYYGGSEEQWNELYFYQIVKVEEEDGGNSGGEEVKTEEKKFEKSEVLGTSVNMHFNFEF